MSETFLAYHELAAHSVPFTRVHLRRLVDTGYFPRPVRLSPNRIAWKLSDIERWKETRPTVARVTEAVA